MTPRWINYTPGVPLTADFLSAAPWGRSLCVNQATGQIYYLDAAGVPTAIISGGGGGGGETTWTAITGKPSTFPPEAHNQGISTITGLQTALDGKQAVGSYANAAHTHIIGDVTGLQGALDGKQPVSAVLTGTTASFTTAQETKLSGIAAGATANSADATLLARANHTGTQTLDTTTDSATRLAMTSAERTKLTGVATGATANATDAALRDRATHTGAQAISTVTGLQTALDAKQATLVSGTSIKTINGVSVLGSGDIVISGGGGSDPWTYIKLASDFPISTVAAGDITGLAFTPVANLQYEFEAVLMLRTALAATGPRPGLAWATGGTDGVARIDTPSSATASTIVQGNISAPLLAAVGGLPNTTGSFPAYVRGTFRAGASPSGSIRLQLASETAGSIVTVRAGSYLKYRII